MITRYTHGFKYFGPLEQNNTGDWVKYSDHQEDVKNQIDAAFLLLNEERDNVDAVTHQLKQTRKALTETTILAMVSSLIVVFESAYFLIKALA
jgi:hypothetical protein